MKWLQLGKYRICDALVKSFKKEEKGTENSADFWGKKGYKLPKKKG